MTYLESAIKKESLSSNFLSAKELLGAAGATADPGSVDVFLWIPKTVSAVALRLSDLDASIVYVKPEKPEPVPEDEKEQIVSLLDRLDSVNNCETCFSVNSIFVVYAEPFPWKLSSER